MQKHFFIYYAGYVTLNSVKTCGYVKWIYCEKIMEIFLALIPTDKSKDTLKNEEIWNKVKRFNRSTNKSPDGYDEKNMKIKFNSDDNLPLRKKLNCTA